MSKADNSVCEVSLEDQIALLKKEKASLEEKNVALEDMVSQCKSEVQEHRKTLESLVSMFKMIESLHSLEAQITTMGLVAKAEMLCSFLKFSLEERVILATQALKIKVFFPGVSMNDLAPAIAKLVGSREKYKRKYGECKKHTDVMAAQIESVLDQGKGIKVTKKQLIKRLRTVILSS